MADQLEATCQQLDALMKDFFFEWGKYRHAMESLSSSMKDGHLSVSKARYSMGVCSVSDLQIPDGDFNAHVKVIPNKIEKQSSGDEGPYFEVSSSSPSKAEVLEEVPKAEKSGNEESSGVRRRHATRNKLNSEADSVKAERNHGKSDQTKRDESVPTVRPDPLKWFGLLVPNSLRQGQTCFKAATSTAVELVNQKVKLNRIIDEYLELKSKKHMFLSNVDTVSSTEEN